MPRALELVRGEDVLGTIDVKPGDADYPWHSGVFHPSAMFESVRGLFEDELRLLRANTTDDPAQWDAWEAAHARLNEPGLWLQGADESYTTDEMLIHIEGNQAWWRLE